MMPNVPKVLLFIDFLCERHRRLLRGIARYSNLHGPWIFYSKAEGMNAKFQLSQLRNGDVNGVIANTLNAKTVKKIVAMGMPTVLANEGIIFPTLSNIETNGTEIGVVAAEYLLNLGFSGFAYCGFKDTIWSLIRGKSFGERIKKAGFPVYFYERPYSKVMYLQENEQLLLANWLRSLPKPVGLMACEDEHAERVIKACKLVNLNVPEQIAILGVDNDELACNLSNPQLSSVVLGREKAGYEAAAILDKLMSGKKITRQKIIVHPTHIVTRLSTNTLAIKDHEVTAAVRFIRKNATQLIQVNDVANAVALSRSGLERRFRKVLGRSVLDEIRCIRANHIAKILIEKKLPVSQIAFTLGYTNSYNLTKFFSRMMGMPPQAYRKKYSQNS